MTRTGRPPTPAVERFWPKVNQEGPLWNGTSCWVWEAGKIRGYGYFALTHRKSVKAHRFAYELMVGPIPEGLCIDHLCRNHSCVNPEHLEAVTLSVNIRRGLLSEVNRERGRQVTHCPRGHKHTDSKKQCQPCRKILRIEKKNAHRL